MAPPAYIQVSLVAVVCLISENAHSYTNGTYIDLRRCLEGENDMAPSPSLGGRSKGA
jgi:hypothetical protein